MTVRGTGNLRKGFAALGLLVAGLMALPAAVTAQAANPLNAPAFQQFPWVREGTDVRPHPGVTIGRLPNGLTYAIMQRKGSRDSASMHMVIAAGSMQERDDQRGLAHFVEHMAFNGSAGIPEGELTKILARHGFKFGSDANAFTTYDNTEYLLELPKTDKETLDTAFFIMRETASKLSFTPEAIERERGVILGEERVRASPSTKASEAIAQVLFKGQRYAERRPIGLPAIISSAPRGTLIDYYRTWYRPELATIVIVGDIDVAEIEARIRDRFGDWQGEGPAPKPVDYGAYVPKGLSAYIYAEPSLPEGISLQWARPVIEGPDTLKARRIGVLKAAALNVFNERLLRRAKEADAPFLSARLAYNNNPLNANTSNLIMVPKPGLQREAMTEVLRFYNQFKLHGVTTEELERTLADRDVSIRNNIEAEKTRGPRAMAASIISARNGRGVFVSAQQLANQWADMRPTVDVASVNEQVAFLTSGDGPFITRIADNREKFDEKALIATYQAAMAMPVTPYEVAAAKPWPYMAFGTPGKVEKTYVDKVFGFTQYTFANGLKVNIKPTKFQVTRVMVGVRFGGGMQLFSPDEKVSLVPVRLYNFPAGGLGKLSQDELRRTLTGKTYGAGFSLGDDAAMLSGATVAADFATQMQLLMAYYTDPGYRPENFDNFKTAASYSYKLMKTNPSTMFALGALPYLSSNDPRLVYPSQEVLAGITNDHVKGLIERTLRNVPIEITVVGDIAPEAALSAIAETFGTLPPLPSGYTVAKGADAIRLPTDRTARVFTHQGRDDQGISFVAFPTTDLYHDLKDARGLHLLSLIFNTRLSEDVREKQGATYSTTVSNIASSIYKDYGYLAAQATVKPEDDERFYASVLAIAASLREAPVTPDELERVRLPVLEGLDNNDRTNARWFNLLPGLVNDPKRQAYNRDLPAQYKAVSAADIQRLAQTYLKADSVLRMKVMPESKAK